VGRLGEFTIGKTDPSWTNTLGLAALDYYSVDDVSFRQILPDGDHTTIDVPSMSFENRARRSETVSSMRKATTSIISS